MILELYPAATIGLSYKILTYKIESGWVALDYLKDGVSIYTNNSHHIAPFKSAFPKIKTCKASFNFKVTDAIDESALEQVINSAMQNWTDPSPLSV